MAKKEQPIPATTKNEFMRVLKKVSGMTKVRSKPSSYL